ncbi:hypothetical protein R9C00_09315 [Flammeovirgaceae bacterium SG7u.111]|nr:hypothetical protein [Flammeovirgaceae bacterium SG7u.132]WPO37647.1 hypothetical protein R9C00_09315 [Flammeovirgaceae bacterium SG7u.111]
MIGHALPEEVKTFYQLLGKKLQKIFTGADNGFNSLAWVNVEARKILKRYGYLLPNNFFPFLFNQGYSFCAITDFEIDDPEVHVYIETEEGLIEKVPYKFTEYLKLVMRLSKNYH